MTNLNSQQRNKAEFKHNRAKVLDNGNAICHWCGIHQATEADHLLPTDAGGTNAIDNLVQHANHATQDADNSTE
jgi:5-methylcytosine-specific restriction endonuclease McrA